jgi:hypothetical protein
MNLKDYAAQLIGEKDSADLSFKLDLPAAYLNLEKNTPPLKNPGEGTDLSQERFNALQDENFSKIEAERKKSLPAIMVSAMAMQETTGMKTYGIMAGIRIPLFSGSVRSAFESEGELLTHTTSEELAWYGKRKHLAAVHTERRINILKAHVGGLDKEIIPTIKQHYSTIAFEYAEGKGSFAGVNNARRLLLRYRLALVAAKRDLALAILAQEGLEAGVLQAGIDLHNPQLPSYGLQGGEMPGMSAPSMQAGMSNAPAGKGKEAGKSMPKTNTGEGMREDTPPLSTSGMGEMK